ncbi:hypothetical protein EMIHUDRAFT_210740 [Emiliania huxleyi CCMP1516]|uniref:Thiamine phosphate synthase/TenI domain-containing protein n=2 Tax=Emiliania huxleyi TaxID=2903 RepID=A0A0D3IYM8_EMIH1|nr:hypothetical protein EMIHUDRAFT_210740 [Emiliania huxleyi CCMP1516]EOD16363.1 hypothetical protein EMIHUDRAFT_210740 [Emiliania huxleyi CCMP1516]|eukprot:XP_005768792.1 hypothetical protein EMIHUDRAFT_210740 [Emiliania huxleyi CCMP1516]
MQWAFLSPVFQPASKPGDTRPHLGERAVVAAQAAHPGLTLHALGGVTPEAAVRLTRDGVGGVCVLGGVWTVRPDGSAEADVRAAERYIRNAGYLCNATPTTTVVAGARSSVARKAKGNSDTPSHG